MAKVVNDNVVILDGATQEIAGPIKVQSIRWVGGASSVADDDLILSESSTGDTSAIVWATTAAGANYVEESSNGGKGFDFRNGVRVNTIDRGKVYLYL